MRIVPAAQAWIMSKFDRLLAKSRRRDEPWRESMLLHVHLTDVHRSAAQVMDASGVQQLSALGLEPAVYGDRLRRIVCLPRSSTISEKQTSNSKRCCWGSASCRPFDMSGSVC